MGIVAQSLLNTHCKAYVIPTLSSTICTICFLGPPQVLLLSGQPLELCEVGRPLLQVGFSTLCAKTAVSQPALMLTYWFSLLHNEPLGKRQPTTQLLGQLQDTQPALTACMLSCASQIHMHTQAKHIVL